MSIARTLCSALLALSLAGQAAAASSELRSYVVRPGDTLYAIARDCGCTVEAIMFNSGLSSVSIEVGQTLVLPGTPRERTTTPTSLSQAQLVVQANQKGAVLNVAAPASQIQALAGLVDTLALSAASSVQAAQNTSAAGSGLSPIGGAPLPGSSWKAATTTLSSRFRPRPAPATPTVTASQLRASVRAVSTGAADLVLGGMNFQYQRLNACGPQSVSSVLSWFGVQRTQDQVAARIQVPGRYTSVDGMRRGFEENGLKFKVVKQARLSQVRALTQAGIPPVALQRLELPSKTDHFRVVRGVDREYVHLLDPYYGPHVVLTHAEFEALWNVQGRLLLVAYPSGSESLVDAALRS